ncbi:MAG: hypothetical protein ACLTDC_13750 [Lachnospiraceae bacterium]
MTFTNHAFMGWAVMDAVFGGESIFYATFANLAFSTYAYTYGVWLMRSTGNGSRKETFYERIYLNTGECSHCCWVDHVYFSAALSGTGG